MAYQVLTVTGDWPDSAQYTASGETDIGLSNQEVATMRYIVNATKPTDLPVTDAFPLTPKDTAYMTLADGEKLWIVAPGQAPDTSVNVTLMT